MKKFIYMTAAFCIMAAMTAACGKSGEETATTTGAAAGESQTSESAAEEPVTQLAVSNNKPVYLYVMDYAEDLALQQTSYTALWTDEEDMGTFAAIAANESEIDFANDYPSEIAMQNEIWDSIETEETYKIGYEISFDVNGEHRVYTILEPADVAECEDLFMGDVYTEEVTGYLGVWLYDDYNQEGGFYDHVDPDEYTDDTLLTSIKLRLTPEYEAVSNLKLKTFSYSSSLEFDEDGHYNNIYASEISIIRE